MTAMMEKMLRDPNMQKMLYPYLPEPMRNPDSIEWMLNNPEVRKQMEQVFAQSVSWVQPWMLAGKLLGQPIIAAHHSKAVLQGLYASQEDLLWLRFWNRNSCHTPELYC